MAPISLPPCNKANMMMFIMAKWYSGTCWATWHLTYRWRRTPKLPHPGNMSLPGMEPGPAARQKRMLTVDAPTNIVPKLVVVEIMHIFSWDSSLITREGIPLEQKFHIQNLYTNSSFHLCKAPKVIRCVQYGLSVLQHCESRWGGGNYIRNFADNPEFKLRNRVL